MQCSVALGHAVQSPPQQSLWQVPLAQMKPATQSFAAMHASPSFFAPAAMHAGPDLPFAVAGRHSSFAMQPMPDWKLHAPIGHALTPSGGAAASPPPSRTLSHGPFPVVLEVV